MARLTAGTRAKGFGVTAGWWRLAIAGAVAVVGGVVPAGLAAASGSNTIATAPVLTYGQLEVAGGKQDEFWRINTFAGDALTIRADLGESTILHFEVYDPSVDDFRIQEAAAVARWDGNGYMSGKREIKLDIPFSGQGTLAFCERNAGGCSDTGRGRPAPTVPFTATVEHRTVTTLGGVPRLVRSPKRRIPLSATVQSPAGIPVGDCIFERLRGTKHTEVAQVPLAGGSCTTRARTGRPGKSRFRVKFVAADGWLDSEATTKRIKTRRPKRHR